MIYINGNVVASIKLWQHLHFYKWRSIEGCLHSKTDWKGTSHHGTSIEKMHWILKWMRLLGSRQRRWDRARQPILHSAWLDFENGNHLLLINKRPFLLPLLIQINSPEDSQFGESDPSMDYCGALVYRHFDDGHNLVYTAQEPLEHLPGRWERDVLAVTMTIDSILENDLIHHGKHHIDEWRGRIRDDDNLSEIGGNDGCCNDVSEHSMKGKQGKSYHEHRENQC